MNTLVKGYVCPVTMVFFGGCGQNALRRIIETHDPDQYPHFYLGGFNTDAMALSDRFVVGEGGENSNLQKWYRAGRLTIEALGKEITHGRGTGANPAKGRLAAETTKSKEDIRKLCDRDGQKVVVFGAGGGTGTGAGPVGAREIKEMGGHVIAVVVMPHPNEKRNERAQMAIQELHDLKVPTFQIFNGALDDYLQKDRRRGKALLTLKEKHQIADEVALMRIIMVLREILQVPAQQIHNDEADFERVFGLEYGLYPFFGLAEIDPADLNQLKAKDIPEKAKQIAEQLWGPRLQDVARLATAKVANLRLHGPLPDDIYTAVETLVHEKIKDGGSVEDVEIHRGVMNDVPDNQIWISLITNGPGPLDQPRAKASSAFIPTRVALETTPEQQKEEVVPHVHHNGVAAATIPTTESAPAVVPSTNGNGARSSGATPTLSFRCNGQPAARPVPKGTFDRYQKIKNNPLATEEEWLSIQEEVRQVTKTEERPEGYRPDLPEKFMPKAEPADVAKKPRSLNFRDLREGVGRFGRSFRDNPGQRRG